MALRIKADHTRNLRDRIIGGNQERLCFPDFAAQRVLHWGIAQHILEGMGHIGLTQPEVPADILDGNWLAVMLVNIFLDPLPQVILALALLRLAPVVNGAPHDFQQRLRLKMQQVFGPFPGLLQLFQHGFAELEQRMEILPDVEDWQHVVRHQRVRAEPLYFKIADGKK